MIAKKRIVTLILCVKPIRHSYGFTHVHHPVKDVPFKACQLVSAGKFVRLIPLLLFVKDNKRFIYGAIYQNFGKQKVMFMLTLKWVSGASKPG
jgi:hypothetical protein